MGTTMDVKASITAEMEEEMNMDLRRGPWTVEEDLALINYITKHGEGRWNSLARCAGLKRTGKSCRLRWLNYLRPDVKRGNITLEEQLLILELHSRWGNRWSKIAQHLPGRTDNEIKNYWRTRVQKHAKQLKCDVNSKQFKDTMRYLWMPRLVERIQAAATTAATATTASPAAASAPMANAPPHHVIAPPPLIANYTPENSSTGAASSDSMGNQVSPVSDLTEFYSIPVGGENCNADGGFHGGGGYGDSMASPCGFFVDNNGGLDIPGLEQSNQWVVDGGDTTGNLWNVEDYFFLQNHLNNVM